jgi:uncharacterized membrane protein
MNAHATHQDRLLAPDALRGLLMILMALDHACFFVAKIGPRENWVLPLPDYPNALAFLTRYVSHLCAPGFSLLLGISMALFYVNRLNKGWAGRQISRWLAIRGIILIILEQLLDNTAWTLAEVWAAMPIQRYRLAAPLAVGGSEAWLSFEVLFELGFSLLFWSLWLRLATVWVLALSLAFVTVSHLLMITLEPSRAPAAAWQLLFVSGHYGVVDCDYPPLPWAALCGFGIVCGRLLTSDETRAYAGFGRMGAALVGGFLLLRVTGFGDVHHTVFAGWIDFLQVTKYPPSPAFITLTIGVDLLLLSAFSQGSRLLRRLSPLLIFGQAALFFYFAHTWLFLLIGLAFPTGVQLPWVYPIWILALIVLYPLCRRFAGFMRAKPLISRWRLL